MPSPHCTNIVLECFLSCYRIACMLVAAVAGKGFIFSSDCIAVVLHCKTAVLGIGLVAVVLVQWVSISQ